VRDLAKHWVTALERNNDKGAQEPFLVRADWSQFHFDADGTRLNPYENVLNPRTVGGIDLKWSYNVGVGVNTALTVVNGVVFFGSDDFNLYAVDANNGAKLWSYNTGGYVYSSPAVANGVVYVGSNDYNVYALNARTGVRVWVYTASSGVYSSPAVANGTVYVGSSGNFSDGNVYALDAQYRGQTVELRHSRRCRILARSGERSGVCRLGGQ
jgi:outer membrane protein assembly factor BamB